MKKKFEKRKKINIKSHSKIKIKYGVFFKKKYCYKGLKCLMVFDWFELYWAVKKKNEPLFF